MNTPILNIIKAQTKYVLYDLHGTLIIFLGVFLYSYFREFRSLTLSAKDVATMRILLVFLGFILIYIIALGLNHFVFLSASTFKDGYHEFFMFVEIGLVVIFLYPMMADYFSIFKDRGGLGSFRKPYWICFTNYKNYR